MRQAVVEVSQRNGSVAEKRRAEGPEAEGEKQESKSHVEHNTGAGLSTDWTTRVKSTIWQPTVGKPGLLYKRMQVIDQVEVERVELGNT